ncbi:hypothetical protein [Burkholderia ubonensis]|uniref:hypothetical protein n=1 Tax=Burkholderia ubonensis TaxID=101571 RepID=UPI000756BD03|nr:hypothetical protein [Burkholderia ubonensis]KVO10260.1 hypothetical protein WJ73_21340 [Burkholderia ubonensis]KVT84190.1 hypothetical protein WK58_31705 [Burkholderia ubonensis]KWC16348.1 hypothetical protein WL47_00270 [Burkholderia ubonensis]
MSQETATETNVADRVASAWNEVIRARSHHQAVLYEIRSTTRDLHEAHRAAHRARERSAGSEEIRQVDAIVSAASQKLTALQADQRNAEIAVATAEIEHGNSAKMQVHVDRERASADYQALLAEWSALIDANRDLLIRLLGAARGERHWRSGKGHDVLTLAEVENLVRNHVA